MAQTNSAPLQLVWTDNALIPAEAADTYSLAMDHALGLRKRSLSAASLWNAQAIELAWSFSPVVCELYGLALRTCASYVQWARMAMGLPGTQAKSSRPQLAEATGGVLIPAGEAEAAEAALAYSMDIAIGAEPASELEAEVISIAAVLNADAELPPAAKPVQSAADEPFPWERWREQRPKSDAKPRVMVAGA